MLMELVVPETDHGVVCSMPGERFGYFGWPSVARLDDGTLIAAASGLRTQHVCPWGRTVLFASGDEGKTWTPPRIVNDTPLDDRDAGIIHLGGGKLLLSWFTSDTRRYYGGCKEAYGDAEVAAWEPVLDCWDDALVDKWLGAWVRISPDGNAWGDFVRVPVTAPHGPVKLHDGSLLYLGNRLGGEKGEMAAFVSLDSGRSWSEAGVVPEEAKPSDVRFVEPHAVEISPGRLIGHIRSQEANSGNLSIWQTESADGGRTWTPPHHLGICGAPPHLLLHSSDAVVCVFGRREPPFGQRAVISRDGGASWPIECVLRDDGPDGDLGYPASVELPGGDIFTVYYQKTRAGEKASLLWTRWALPG